MSHLQCDPSKIERWSIVYPSYLNSKKTVAEGRRIPKDKPNVCSSSSRLIKLTNTACENPTVNEIKDVCQSRGFNCSVENKQYPRDSAKDALCKGRVRVQLKNSDGKPVNSSLASKKELFIFLGEMIPKLKSRQNKSQGDSSGSQSSASNTNKKKKGKKGKAK